MASGDGRYVVTFNGEIYNYPSLRKELEAEEVAFRSTSDTEVLLHLFARDGATMEHRLRGMYAFAIWDSIARRLFLARDPYESSRSTPRMTDGPFASLRRSRRFSQVARCRVTPSPRASSVSICSAVHCHYQRLLPRDCSAVAASCCRS